MAKFSFLFNQEEETLEDTLDLQFQEKKAGILAGAEAFEKHVAEAKNMSLYDGLLALGANIEAVSSGGFPSILVGDETAKPSLALNTGSAINAVLAMAAQKYSLLKPFMHDAWFDPRYNAEAVRTVWSEKDGRWIVFNWSRKGDFYPSNWVVPAPSGTAWKDMNKGQRHYSNQWKKHQAISEYLLSKEYDTPWLIVMNRESELTHFQKVIRDRLEMPLTEVWEAINNDWNDANVRNQLTSSKPTRGTSSVKPSEERQEFASKLAKLRTDHMVSYVNGLTGTTSTVLFPASDPDRKAISLEKILGAAPEVQYTGLSKVETK
jgi:hypothetical protein